MTREEIEQSFINAGWNVAECSHRMLVGTAGNLSIRAYEWVWESDEPVFELYDEASNLTYWVPRTLRPRHAAILIEGRGGPPKEQRGIES